jgi:flagellar assembly protein FliH
MDDQVDELRDLALSVAEKVVCISLKSSSEVIARMIQTAIDKKKHKEWVRIYVSECDAKKMTQIPQSLTSALASLSDRVRIIPVADDEPGTCIIEMPDEIIDASASTQLNNLRGMLLDVPGGGSSALMS